MGVSAALRLAEEIERQGVDVLESADLATLAFVWELLQRPEQRPGRPGGLNPQWARQPASFGGGGGALPPDTRPHVGGFGPSRGSVVVGSEEA